jgi:ABC-type transporter Mla maintaining outer membrane lipid asymmetry permease subunit MlaE
MLTIIWTLARIFCGFLIIGLIGALFFKDDLYDYNERAYWEWEQDL